METNTLTYEDGFDYGRMIAAQTFPFGNPVTSYTQENEYDAGMLDAIEQAMYQQEQDRLHELNSIREPDIPEQEIDR